MSKLDLSLGHPLYLRDYWVNASLNFNEGNLTLQAHNNLAYGPHEGDSLLKNEIIRLHQTVGNAEVLDRHILIGHGATQVLNAVLAQSPFPEAYARPPYFFRFPQLFEAQGLIEISGAEAQSRRNFTELVTHPSNPDFTTYKETASKWKVHDLCYNWPQYDKVTKRDEDIMVFSLAKCTGHAGTRIGWAIIKDEAIYHRALDFIEVATGGVSRDAQLRAAVILENQSRRYINKQEPYCAFDIGRAILEERWMKLNLINLSSIQFVSQRGMFLWCYVPHITDAQDYMSKRFGVVGTSGVKCGATANHVRFNIGCSNEDFDTFIERLRTR
jgi:L-tryptophan--pyruvate aminotransferase